MKKILSFMVSIFIIFSVGFTEAKPIHTQGKNSSKISRKAKIIGGDSAAVVAASALGVGVYGGCCSPLHVLIIGGDEATRNDLIETLRNNDSHPETLSGVNPTELMVREAESYSYQVSSFNDTRYRLGKVIRRFEEWRNFSCDANDPNAERLVKDAGLIICILTDKESSMQMNKIVEHIVCYKMVPTMVLSVLGEKYPVSSFDDEQYKPYLDGCSTFAEFFDKNSGLEWGKMGDMLRWITMKLNCFCTCCFMESVFYWKHSDNTFYNLTPLCTPDLNLETL